MHVSSVTEWSLAMRLIWGYADVSGNKAWRGLSVAMTPFLASGFAACTFHLFYNAPAGAAASHTINTHTHTHTQSMKALSRPFFSQLSPFRPIISSLFTHKEGTLT